MTNRMIPIWTALVLATGGAAIAQNSGGSASASRSPGMTLTSPDFSDGGVIPDKYTQKAPNPGSPQLEWTHVPAGTSSFVLLMHDPDVARQKSTTDMLHWLVINIPGSAHGLPAGIEADPKLSDGAIQLKNGGNTVGYRGPGAPAPGPNHHYTLELYALDTNLNLGPDASREDVLKAMDGHILAKAVLVGLFHR